MQLSNEILVNIERTDLKRFVKHIYIDITDQSKFVKIELTNQILLYLDIHD